MKNAGVDVYYTMKGTFPSRILPVFPVFGPMLVEDPGIPVLG
jgi:hypothetical protein